MLSHNLQLSVPTGRSSSAPSETALHAMAMARRAVVGPLNRWVSMVDASCRSGSAAGDRSSEEHIERLHEFCPAFKGLDVREFILSEYSGNFANVRIDPRFAGPAR